MGWKSSAIIVNPKVDVNESDILESLGFFNLKEIESEPFEVAMNPRAGRVYIGSFRDNLLICSKDLPLTFLEAKVNKYEMVLSKCFPNSEISSIALHSGTNFWGYSVSKNGEKVRVRVGNSENGTIIEHGDPLEQELSLLTKSEVLENGRRVYHSDNSTDEMLEEDEFGEQFVFVVASRYFGANLDLADDLLSETELNGFTFSPASADDRESADGKTTTSKWRQGVIIVIVVLIYQVLERMVFNN